MYLYDYSTAEQIGPATVEQIEASMAAGDTGAIVVDADSGQVLPEGADKSVWPSQRVVYVASRG